MFGVDSMTSKFSRVYSVDRRSCITICTHSKQQAADSGSLCCLSPDDKNRMDEYTPECFICASKRSLIFFGYLMQIRKNKALHPAEYLCMDCLWKLKYSPRNLMNEKTVYPRYPVHYIRKIGRNNNCILPTEIICRMKPLSHLNPIFILACDDSAEIRYPYQNHCFLCGSDEVYLLFKNIPLCATCVKLLKDVQI